MCIEYMFRILPTYILKLYNFKFIIIHSIIIIYFCQQVWLLNAGNENSNYEQKTSNCGCENEDTYQRFNGCKIIVMDWLANGRILVTLVII